MMKLLEISQLYEYRRPGRRCAARLLAGGVDAMQLARPMTTLVCLMALYPLAALAADSGDLRIEKQDRAYMIRMSFDVPANAYQVRSVITDYRNPARLSSVVKKREIISQEGGVTRVATEMRGCVVFFCRTMKLVQDVVV